MFWHICRERVIEQHLYCEPCQAVDSDDEGKCPVCQRPLSHRAHFIFTTYSDEQKMLSRRSFLQWRGA